MQCVHSMRLWQFLCWILFRIPALWAKRFVWWTILLKRNYQESRWASTNIFQFMGAGFMPMCVPFFETMRSCSLFVGMELYFGILSIQPQCCLYSWQKVLLLGEHVCLPDSILWFRYFHHYLSIP
jgi:hypothetical protein